MKKQLSIIILIVLIFSGCKKYTIEDIEVLPWDTEIALPLVNSTFYVSDIFEIGDNSVLEYIDVNEGLLGITYSGKILSYDADEIVEVSDQNFNTSLLYPDPGLPVNITDTIYQSVIFDFDFESQNLDGVEVKHLKMLAGSLDLTVNSNIAYLSNIEIQIPHMKKNGVVYQFESDVEPGVNVSDSEELEEYILDLSQENLTYNQLKINYRLIIEYEANMTPTGENVDIQFHFNQPKLDYIVGYFGMNSIADQTDTIKIEIFDNTIQGHFQFLDPYMYVDFNNSFGFPTLIDITEFKSVNQNTGVETPLYLEGLTDTPVEISYPLQIGDSTLDAFYFDNTNSNIEVVLNDADKYIIWGLSASSNPNGPTNGLNFLSHESKMEASTRLTVPLKGYAWDWVFTDTTRIDSGSVIDNPEEVKELTLRLILDNGFPAEGIVQIYTLDSLFQVTDSLFETPTQILESGILVDGIITEPSKTITDILVIDSKKDNFINAKSLITTAKMQTTNGSEQEVIQIYDYYSIGVQLGIKALIHVDPESL